MLKLRLPLAVALGLGSLLTAGTAVAATTHILAAPAATHVSAPATTPAPSPAVNHVEPGDAHASAGHSGGVNWYGPASTTPATSTSVASQHDASPEAGEHVGAAGGYYGTASATSSPKVAPTP